jgi:hypothetical protein
MRLARVGFVLIDLSIFLPQPPDMLLLISSNDLLALQLQHIPQPADPDGHRSGVIKDISRRSSILFKCGPFIRKECGSTGVDGRVLPCQLVR